MRFVYDDGGREAAGYTSHTDDCVTRAIAIVTKIEYQDVYDAINETAQHERPRAGKRRSTARGGVFRKTYERYLTELGWTWVPTMQIGSGCTVHLREDELPDGRIIARLSKHVCAVIDGVIHDTHDPSRDGTRCVYGMFIKE
jgi:hypothetical protein